MADWTFLTDHAHVLVLLARDPRTAPADLAAELGMPAGEVDAILSDLLAGGYISEQPGNEHPIHVVNRALPLRHPVEAHHSVGRLLDAVQTPSELLEERLLH